MISFERVTLTYPGGAAPTLREVNLEIPEGELALVIGATGAGKSTLLRAVNGLVPHFSGGRLTGRVRVGGRSTADHRPRELADVVGFVGQDPDSTFVADIVEDELAYGMENLGVDPAAMRRRVEDVLDVLNLHAVRQRAIASLSGGQRQRVAIGAALTAASRVLVLDEPTSSLDPVSAEEVLAALSRLVHDQGVTILVAEHRLERVAHAAERIVHVPGGGDRVVAGPPAEVLATTPIAPPVVELARCAGWIPIPLSVRDARRFAPELRARLGMDAGAGAGLGWLDGPAPGPGEVGRPAPGPRRVGLPAPGPGRVGLPAPGPGRVGRSAPGPELGRVRRLGARYGRTTALAEVDLQLVAGEVVGLLGRNGSGKTTLLQHLVGLRRPQRGSVVVGGQEPGRLAPGRAARVVGLVPQDPGSLLTGETVVAECAASDDESGLPAGTTRDLLDRLLPGVGGTSHPRDLSEGQRLALALAVVLAPAPPLLLLDEPTRGLDYPAKARLTATLRELAATGHGVVVATHDVELAAAVADRVVVLADGEIISDGPTREVMCSSPGLAPQVARILAPARFLTVDEVRAALVRSRV